MSNTNNAIKINENAVVETPFEQLSDKSQNNLRIYEEGRKVPSTAKKPIEGGRLNGFTDVNPMWRIKKLTELFGPCGEGWKVEKVNEKYIPFEALGTMMYVVDIHLFVKFNGVKGDWSEPIFGTGGSMLVKYEKKFLVTDDDALKKAYTDALSVACKALGIAADVYYDKDVTKYGELADFAPVQLPTPTPVGQSGNGVSMVQQMNDITGDGNNATFNVAQTAVADAIKEAQTQASANAPTNTNAIVIDPATVPVPTVQEAEGYLIEGKGKYTGKTVGELFRLVCSCDAQAQGWLNWLLDNPQQTENMAKAQFYARFLVSYYQQNAGQTNNA